MPRILKTSNAIKRDFKKKLQQPLKRNLTNLFQTALVLELLMKNFV